jgi:hypothetical protein
MRNSLIALAVLVGGCHWTLNDPGTDPKPSQLYFPSGIAMDPGGRFAYVSNGNADLRYGGGTVMVADMLAFECTIARFRQLSPVKLPQPGDPPPPPFPVACGDPSQWDLGMNGSLCRPDPLDPTIVDCDESGFVRGNSTVRIGNFAGAVKVRVDPHDPANKRRLFVAVRGDPSITMINVDLSKEASTSRVLDCYDPSHRLPPPAAPGQQPPSPTPCDVSALAQQFYCQGLPACTLGSNGTGPTQLPTEPFGMEIDESRGMLLVSHLSSGQVSLLSLEGAPANALLATSSPFFPLDSSGRHGAFSLAKQHPADPSSSWYLTSNLNPEIATFRIADATVVVAQTAFALSASFAQGGDVRDIAFDIGGNRAFVTENNPPTALVLDTRPVGINGNQAADTVTDIIDVCQTPSHLRVTRLGVAGAPGAPTYHKTKLVVVCFLSSQIMIVDADRSGVDDTIFSGMGGPNDLAFNFFGDGAQPAGGVGRHAYVTNFSESTIAVVDLEPGSATENRVIARLGFPPDGFNP